MTWQPSSSIVTLQQRANIIAAIRAFFSRHRVWEVETPSLSQHTVTDVHVHSLQTRTSQYHPPLFLQTSPEYYMKRLLAAGSGPIFQITKSFRDDPCATQHHYEFSLLEWYQPGLDHHGLMAQVDQLVQSVMNTPPAEKISYQALFQRELDLDPHNANLNQLQNRIQSNALYNGQDPLDTDTCLTLLMSMLIEPKLGQHQPVFIYNYPASQAALARCQTINGNTVAARFELYYQGTELANGFYELNDTAIQRKRFIHDNKQRKQRGLCPINLDEEFLACLEHLPDCAGVALGLDRLIMLALKANRIEEVISFV